MQRRAAIALTAVPILMFAFSHVACLEGREGEGTGEGQAALASDASDASRREKLESRLKELREKARRLKERCAELAKRGKEWISNKDNQHKVCRASCDLANEWGSDFCDVVGIVCAVKIKIGWPLLFCLGAQQICDAGIQNFDVAKCKAMCDAKFGSDSGADASSDAAADSSTKTSAELDYDWSVFGNGLLPPSPLPALTPPAPAESEAESCEACDAELARLETEIAELERELATLP